MAAIRNALQTPLPASGVGPTEAPASACGEGAASSSKGPASGKKKSTNALLAVMQCPLLAAPPLALVMPTNPLLALWQGRPLPHSPLP